MHGKELAGRLRKRENDNDLSPNSSSSPAERFRCPHPECNKTFSRQEHLSRHKLNHWPKEIYVCSYVLPTTNAPCNKTFVRKDLLIRHEKRHSKYPFLRKVELLRLT
ncbi:BCN_G0055320.mRNA.1.CDS.1 [Saccharomyces cerevisiae]|nr:BCN_G0055320.mRNA.1.CDS.1 [Saccharomyces cerevisiae]CAI7380581.1 BCN_G0055320.mRNA.1.CDS.1 [Saccharomyces cerevisiae]